MDEDAVKQSKILKQGLENMNIIDDLSEQQSVSLESLGMSSTDLKKLLSSVSKPDNVSMVFPEVDSESRTATSIRAAIRETQQRMNELKGSPHMLAEMQKRLDHLEAKLGQELGVEPLRRVPANRLQAPVAAASGQPMLPGAWRARNLVARNGPAMAASRAQHEEKSRGDEHKFDAGKVESDWTEYYLKNPAEIDKLNSAAVTDNHAEAQQYNSYYGPGVYAEFIAAKRRAAATARKRLTMSRTQSKPYFQDFSM